MKIRTADLTGAALDWAVGKALGANLTTSHEHFRRIAALSWSEERIAEQLTRIDNYPCFVDSVGNSQPVPAYSTNWAQGGPIIEREGTFRIIGPKYKDTAPHVARLPNGVNQWFEQQGFTPLIAAMRCFVASKLGDEVDVPKELVS